MSQVSLGLRLDAKLVAEIDRVRGDVPRAKWIARACEEKIKRAEPTD